MFGRLEPLCPVHNSCGEQGPQEVQVLRCVSISFTVSVLTGRQDRTGSDAVMLHVDADTLHRFCKKEHDWGWKKFMELSKVLDGFTVADTLVIKAQVQVIL